MRVPAVTRPLMEDFNQINRMCFVLPRNTDGSVEFVGNLLDEEMEVLLKDEEFTGYAMDLC